MIDKICTNCKHCGGTIIPAHWQQIECNHPNLNINGSFNPVLGVPYKVAEFCYQTRLEANLCGIEGNWYAPRASVAYVESLLSVPTMAVSAKASEKAKAAAFPKSKKITLDDLL